MNWQAILDPTLCGRLCMTLVHSLWQVAILAVLAWGAGRLLLRKSPRIGYAVHVAALLIALAAMPVTFALVDVGSTSKLDEESTARTSVQAGTVVSNEPSAAEKTPARGDVVPVAPAANRVAANPRSSFGSQVPASSTRGRSTAPVPLEPSPKPPQKKPSLLWPRVAPWLAAVYLLGVLLMLARLLRGMWTAQRLAARAELLADGPLADRLKSLAAAWSMRVVPLLAKSEAVVVPKVIGLLRPMILLPVSAISGLSTEELEMILAHELAHVRRYDMWVNLLQRMAEAVLFFNPALWILSRRISTLREYCCDELTCGTPLDTGDTELRTRYASALLRVVEVSGRTPEPADVATLAAARSPSELRRRVSRLFGEPLPEPVRLSRGGLCTIAVLAAFFLLAPTVWHSSPESVAAPEEVAEAKENDKKADDAGDDLERMTIYVTSKTSGEPLAGVEMECCGYLGNVKYFKKTLKTDGRGVVDLRRPKSAKMQSFWVKINKAGFVPVFHTWRGKHKSLDLPERLDLAMSEGRSIGGRVEDEQEEPVAGAEVDLTMPVSWARGDDAIFSAAELKTDENGRWSWDAAPEDAGKVTIRVSHPDYRPGRISASPHSDNLVVLKRGLKVSGRVTDSEGNPVVGATALLGFGRKSKTPHTKTDDEGRYVIDKCEAGPSAVTVQAPGLSPATKKITISGATRRVDFVLAPGRVLRGKVVDMDGKPIRDATVACEEWRGVRTLQHRVKTDAEGRFEWDAAPPDDVSFSIFKEGHMSRRNLMLAAGPEERVVTLHPALEITGRVTDAETGKPVEEFALHHAYLFEDPELNYWTKGEDKRFTGGEYRYAFSEPMLGYQLQVTALGYAPKTSRVFKSDEGTVAFNFELKRGNGPSGIVMTPDGSPAVGADVGLATRENRAQIRDGWFAQGSNHAELVKTDERGRFVFPPPGAGKYLLIIIHKTGFAEVPSDALPKGEPIVLAAWGKLRGRVLLGDKPDARREVVFRSLSPTDFKRGRFTWGYDYETKTDDKGRFAFDRVIPGPGAVARVVATEVGSSIGHSPGWQTPVTIKPNETTEVVIGGTGRPVVGKVVLERKPEAAVDWTVNEPVVIVAWDKEKGLRNDPHGPYYGKIEKSGAFRIPDVPAGEYKLTVPVNGPRVPNRCGSGVKIGRAQLVFTVPEMSEGRSDEPLDLGTITAKVFDTLDVGEMAPDFAIENLRGGTIRLSKLRGKLVLLDFWATWCGPCLEEMPTLKEIQKKHGDNPRFALVSISCDNETAAPREYVEENGLSWTQTHVPGTYAKVAMEYTVKSIPATFLIGPNGKVLAKNRRGEALKKAVSEALEDEMLFTGKFDTKPYRFPVVRFDVDKTEKETAKPAIVVMDDVDPNFDGEGPHHDAVRAFDSNGKELWAHTELNNRTVYRDGHGVVLDRRRGRIYFRENVGDRITALDFAGRKRWHVDNIDADTLAVDAQTGNLWCSCGRSTDTGETVVFDQDGNEIATYPYRAMDMAYDPNSDAFWLVGREILKLSRNGEVLFREPSDGWCCNAVSVNPNNGRVWVAENYQMGVPDDRLSLRNPDGSVARNVALGDEHVFVLECDPRGGGAFFGGIKMSLERVSPDGKRRKIGKFPATAVSVSPTTGDIWIATEEAVLRLDEAGNIKVTIPFTAKSGQSWIAAF